MSMKSKFPRKINVLVATVGAILAAGGALFGILGVWFMAALFKPDATQNGPRGTGMLQYSYPADVAALAAANKMPEPQPAADTSGKSMAELGDTYKNVQVLGSLSEGEFTRLMSAITEWIVPADAPEDQQGCAYCHNVENMAEDSRYTKIVARRMLQMTHKINQDWTKHVGATGVTCYTCHRGQPVPKAIWFNSPELTNAGAMIGGSPMATHPAASLAQTSLPGDPLATLFPAPQNIRLQGTTALPTEPGRPIQAVYDTYGLMIRMSTALGVNCTFCHNTQSFQNWEHSTPQRVTAWHGLRMVQDLNATYLEPLKATFPANRLGPMGDAPKVLCATCHQGAQKPLLGAQMLKDYVKELSAAPVN